VVTKDQRPYSFRRKSYCLSIAKFGIDQSLLEVLMTEQIILIAIIQGITEFLPISSSGHLNLVHGLAGYNDQGLAMDVAVHVGTVLAVILYNLRVIKEMIISVLSLGKSHHDKFGVSLATIIATIPVVIAGFILNQNDGAIEWLRSVEVVGWATLIFGIVLGITDRSQGRRRFVTITGSDALVIGFSQILALIPGTSRAGITMSAARMMGLSRRAAARFSMILSIPVILGSGLLKGLDLYAEGNLESISPLIIGGLLAMVIAFMSIGAMMAIIQRIGFMPFVIYRVILGLVLLGSVYLF